MEGPPRGGKEELGERRESLPMVGDRKRKKNPLWGFRHQGGKGKKKAPGEKGGLFAFPQFQSVGS